MEALSVKERRVLVVCVVVALLMLGGFYLVDRGDPLRSDVEDSLDALAAELVADRPDGAEAYAERLRRYLGEHPAFHGSAVALIDSNGAVTASPYLYRADEGLVTLDLATPSYRVEAQDWFVLPLGADAAVWTEPYFDAGGGEIWMVTRAVPLRDEGGLFGVLTTDIPAE